MPPLLIDAVPPNSLEAEQSTLSAMLLEEPAICKVAALLRDNGQDFYRESHQALYSTILDMHRQGHPVDLVTLKEELESRGGLENIGGLLYLTSLFNTLPTAANAEYYAKIVLLKSQQREVIATALEIANDARTEDPVALWKKAEVKLGRIAERTPAGKGVTTRRKSLEDRMIDLADVQPPLDLPLMFGRYLLKGTAHWLTGATGLGKSTLAYNIATSLAEGNSLWGIECEQQKVLYVDMESGDVGRALKVERLYLDAPRIRGGLIFLREPMKLPDELSALLAYVQQKEIALVIFDTARRVFSVKDENDNAEFYNRIAPTLDALKQIGVASLTMGHPSKNGNGSARGAGAQEDAGDVNLSLTLFRGEINDPNSVIALRVTKNRLLGHVPPLYLKRIGKDQFEPVTSDGPGPAVETSRDKTKADKCQAAIIEFFSNQPDNYASYTVIIQAMKEQGFSPSTAKRAFDICKEETFILPAPHSRYPKGGWLQNDPFADEDTV